MKLSCVLLALWHTYTAAQTVTITVNATEAASTTSSIVAPTVSLWLNISSGAPVSIRNAGAGCTDAAYILTCTSSVICGDMYDQYLGYTAGPNWFISQYGRGGEGNPTQFRTSQSCTLVGGSSNVSSFSCVGRYTTNPFQYATSPTVSPMTTSHTFTWPTADMLLTGLPITTDLQYMLATGDCAQPSAANAASHVTSAIVLGSALSTALLVMLS